MPQRMIDHINLPVSDVRRSTRFYLPFSLVSDTASSETSATMLQGSGFETTPYHEHYFAGFFRDPDGHNVEIVCHRPSGA